MSHVYAPREDLLARLLGAVHCARLEHTPIVIPLTSLPDEERAQLDRLVGEGVKTAYIRAPVTADVHDTLLPGVWRTRHFDDDGEVVSEELEIGDVPRMVTDAGLSMSNAPAAEAASPSVARVVRQVLTWAMTWQRGDANLVIPITGGAEHRRELARVLGLGPVVADSRSLGHCEQRLTHLRRVWWLRYLSVDEHVAIELLEIGDAPSELRVGEPELDATEQRLLASLVSPGDALP